VTPDGFSAFRFALIHEALDIFVLIHDMLGDSEMEHLPFRMKAAKPEGLRSSSRNAPDESSE